MTLLITCDTGGTQVPPFVTDILRGDPIRDSDSGGSAGWAARRMSDQLGAPLLINPFRSDLIDVGRSLHHRRLFGRLTRGWAKTDRQRLIEAVYLPYRDRVERSLQVILQQTAFVVHVSVRSFAWRPDGRPRRTDVGLSYDPARGDEADLCMDWIDASYDLNVNLKVRRNYPKRGTIDSVPRALRCQFPPDRYLGVEAWMNRAWLDRPGRLRDQALWSFTDALRLTVGLERAGAA